MVGYQVLNVFFIAFYQAFFQHPFYFADFVEVTSPDIGVGDSSSHPQALKCFFADFQEGADLVTVHPNFILIGAFCFHVVENVIRNSGNLVV